MRRAIIVKNLEVSSMGTSRVFLGLLFLSSGPLISAAEPRVSLVKTPNAGIQPQAISAAGTLHLIYFKGDPAGGDLFYVRRGTANKRFSEPIRVNSQPGSAIAVGTIRGGQIALGKGGRVHVAWNGSGKAEPRSQGKYTSPMLYARLNDAGTAFEDQRNLMQLTTTLDGGGTVASDSEGNVYVAWHAIRTGDPTGELNRKVWLARSTDEGKTFGQETSVNPKPTGVCACCSMRAFVDSKGSLHLLYRSAGESRDIYLLTSKEKGKNFQGVLVHAWDTPV
jgi:hypothetical protein